MPNDPKPTVERVFTFGYGHTDPHSGAKLDEQCAIVRAFTVEQCRTLMNERYNRQWAFEYESIEAASVGNWFPRVHEIITAAWVPTAPCDALIEDIGQVCGFTADIEITDDGPRCYAHRRTDRAGK